MNTVTNWYKAKTWLMILSIILLGTLPHLQNPSAYALTPSEPFPSLDPTPDICPAGPLKKADETIAAQSKILLLNSPQFKTFRQELRATYGDTFRLQSQHIYAVTNGCHLGVYVPITGGAGHSFYGLWFDQVSEEPVQTISGLFTANSDQNISAHFTVGDQQIEAMITPEGRLIDGVIYVDGKAMAIPARETSQADFWTCMDDCLAEIGIPGWVFTALTVICAVICAFTLTIGCWGCVLVAAGIYGLEVSLCWQQCTGVTIYQTYLPLIISAAR